MPGELIDLHVHVFPPRMFEAVWQYFETRGWSVHHEHAADIARTLTAHGVSRAVTLHYPHKPGVAGDLNRFAEDVAQVHPIFLPFAAVHVEDADLRAEVDRVIASPHLHGFKFQPLVQAFDVNDPRLDYLWGACCEAGFPVLAHLGTAPMSCPWVGVAHLDRLLHRFPTLRLCVAHLGAFESDAFLARMDRFPDLFLDTAMIAVRTDLFDTTFRGDADALARHADRIAFGSDWPDVPYPYQEALDSLARLPLPPSSLADLRSGSARRFLRLEG